MNPSAPGALPEISVVMSCYNSRRWLAEAIGSVLSQTHSDFEFIIVDDGSTDDSWATIQRYATRDRRIVALSKGNSGLADSLNAGISVARGKWIARIDADDVCEPGRLAEQMAFVRANPQVVLLGSGCVEIDEYGRPLRAHRYPAAHRTLVRNLELLQKFFKLLVLVLLHH